MANECSWLGLNYCASFEEGAAGSVTRVFSAFFQRTLPPGGVFLTQLYPGQPKMPFKHSPLPKHQELVGSYCLFCGKLVAASLNTEILIIIERLHDCPPSWNQHVLQLQEAA